jgi:hypothetical protein
VGWDPRSVQGHSDDQRELLDVESLAGHLIASGSVFGFLAAHRSRLFPPELFEDLNAARDVDAHVSNILTKLGPTRRAEVSALGLPAGAGGEPIHSESQVSGCRDNRAYRGVSWRGGVRQASRAADTRTLRLLESDQDDEGCRTP